LLRLFFPPEGGFAMKKYSGTSGPSEIFITSLLSSNFTVKVPSACPPGTIRVTLSISTPFWNMPSFFA